jgi:hypothetical protein
MGYARTACARPFGGGREDDDRPANGCSLNGGTGVLCASFALRTELRLFADCFIRRGTVCFAAYLGEETSNGVDAARWVNGCE